MKRGKATTPSRADELFYEQSKRIWVHTDRLFVWLMLFQWVAGVVAALTVSPLTWKGVEYSVHIHVWAAVFLGGLISVHRFGDRLNMPDGSPSNAGFSTTPFGNRTER